VFNTVVVKWSKTQLRAFNTRCFRSTCGTCNADSNGCIDDNASVGKGKSLSKSLYILSSMSLMIDALFAAAVVGIVGIAGSSAIGIAGSSATRIAGSSATGIAGSPATGIAGSSATGIAGSSATGIAGSLGTLAGRMGGWVGLSSS
jgi:hypothetical protein